MEIRHFTPPKMEQHLEKPKIPRKNCGVKKDNRQKHSPKVEYRVKS